MYAKGTYLCTTLTICVLLAFTLTQVHAQSGGLRTFGGSGGTNWNDVGYSILQNPDGTYMIAGYSESGFIYDYANNIRDMLVVKLNTDGTLASGYAYGENYTLDPNVPEEEARSIIRTADGGYALAGRHFDPSGGTGMGYQMFAAKINAAGNSILWSRHIGGTNNESAWSIIQTDDDLDGSFDDGYLVAGGTVTYPVGMIIMNAYFTKLDASGNISWTRACGIGSGGTANGDEVYSVVQYSDGSYYSVGYTGIVAGTTAGGDDIMVLKLNAGGTVAWVRTIGSAGDEYGNCIIKTTDGGFVIAGQTNSAGGFGGTDMYIVKINSSGTVVWDRRVGGASTDVAQSVAETPDGSFVVCGYTSSYGEGTNNDAYIVKLTSAGAVSWTRTVGTGVRDRAYGVVPSSDGGYAIAGYRGVITSNNCDVLFIKLNSDGDLSSTCTKSSGGSDNAPGWSSVARTIGENTTGSSTGTGANLNSGGTIITSCGTIALLPVELTEFEAVYTAGAVLSRWETASERNNDYFTVERSIDGKNWTLAGTVAGSGTTSMPHAYSFIDQEPPGTDRGFLYYRLKQTDYDGRSEYFGPIAVAVQEPEEWGIVMQNPAQEEIRGTLFMTEDAGVILEVTDMSGRVVLSETRTMEKGSHLLRLPAAGLAPGMYVLRLYDRNKQIAVKFTHL